MSGIYSLRVKHTAHNGRNFGSSPNRPTINWRAGNFNILLYYVKKQNEIFI
jgi:hypothetical protein